MKQSEAHTLVNAVGGKNTALEIVFGGLEPFENRFKWWDIESQNFSLVKLSNSSIYTPYLKLALRTLKLI